MVWFLWAIVILLAWVAGHLWREDYRETHGTRRYHYYGHVPNRHLRIVRHRA